MLQEVLNSRVQFPVFYIGKQRERIREVWSDPDLDPGFYKARISLSPSVQFPVFYIVIADPDILTRS